MAVTQGITGFEDIAQGLASIGKGAGESAFPKTQRENALRADPTKMQALSQAYRKARAVGKDKVFLDSLGVGEGFGAQLSAYQPDELELTEPGRVAAANVESDVAVKTGEALLGSGLIQQRVETEVDVDQLLGEEARAALNLGLPATEASTRQAVLRATALRAHAEGEQIETLREKDFFTVTEPERQIIAAGRQITEDTFQESYFKIAKERGIDRLQVDADKFALKTSIQDDRVNLDHSKKYAGYINDLAQSDDPKDRRMAAMATVFSENPAFGNYMFQREQMDARALVGGLGSASSEGEFAADVINLTGKMSDRLNDAVENLHNLREDGADDDIIQQALLRVQNEADLIRDMQNNGLTMPIDLVTVDMESEELQPEHWTSDTARQVATNFVRITGGGSIEEQIAETENAIATLSERNLPSKDKRDYADFLATHLVKLQDRAEQRTRSDAAAVSIQRTGSSVVDRARPHIAGWIQKLTEPLYEVDETGRRIEGTGSLGAPRTRRNRGDGGGNGPAESPQAQIPQTPNVPRPANPNVQTQEAQVPGVTRPKPTRPNRPSAPTPKIENTPIELNFTPSSESGASKSAVVDSIFNRFGNDKRFEALNQRIPQTQAETAPLPISREEDVDIALNFNADPLPFSLKPEETTPVPIPEAPKRANFGVGKVYTREDGILLYDSPRKAEDGTVPTHRVDQIRPLLQGMTIDQYEEMALQRPKEDFPPEAFDTVRSISALEPSMQPRMRRLLQQLEAQGIKATIVETSRPQERQEWLFQQGRSRPGDIITWTLTSNHTPGRGVDLLINDDWSGSDPGYKKLWKLAEELGLESLKAKDPGHVALPDSTEQR